MSVAASITAFLTGDSPAWPPGRAEARTVGLLGLRIPLQASAFILLVTALIFVNRAVDFLPAYGPIDPRSIRDKAIEQFVLFGLVPLATLLALGEDPRRYGLGLGDVRRGLVLLAVLVAVTVPAIALVVALSPELQAYYGPQLVSVPDTVLSNAVELFAAEFMLRGFLMFTLFRAIGPLGIVVAVVPFAFQHMDKPLLEAFSTLGGGLVFGWLDWRTQSIWYAGAYHVGIQATAVIVAGGLLPR